MPRCKHCRDKFEAKYFLQKYCLKDDECIDAELKERAEKLASKEQKPKAKINNVSDKRKIENREYKIKRLQFLAQPGNQKCPVTGEKATEVHHTYSGANRSRFYLDESTWIAVSRTGHLWIHANPAEARELNYLKSY